MGRTKIDIDWGRVEEMAIKGANGAQIAGALGVHYDTLVNRFKEDNTSDFSKYLTTKKEKGNQLLHEKQWEVAMTGDKTMLVWLGKQRLGQTERQQTDITTGGDKITKVELIKGHGADS